MAKKKRPNYDARRHAQIPGDHPTARGTNVKDYFLIVLGRPEAGGDREGFNSLADFPVDSEVGDCCVMAINAARVLLDHVYRATGDDYPDRNDAVLDVAFHICMTYAHG